MKHALLNWSSSFSYVWQNEFNHQEKLLLSGLLLRIFVEYLSFFVILSDHHSLAMDLFNTTTWYPATLYFEIAVCGFFVLELGVIGFLTYRGITFNPRQWLGRLAFMLPIIFFGILYLVLKSQSNPWLWLIFILVGGLFIIAVAVEKCILVHCWLSVIRNDIQFHTLIKLIFMVVAASLLCATILHKLTMFYFMSGSPHPILGFGVMPHPATYQVMFIPLLLLNVFSSGVEQFLAQYKTALSHQQVLKLRINLQRNWQNIFAKSGMGMLIGAFLVEWYFILPFLVSDSAQWSAERISLAILLASCLSLLTNFILVRFLAGFKLESLFAGLLIGFIAAIIFVSCNLFHQHLTLLCILILALFYNSLQAVVNKIIHYEQLSWGVSLAFLLIGSEFNLVASSFLSSGMNVFLLTKLGNTQQIWVLPIVLGIFVVICLISYRFLHAQQNKPVVNRAH